jgi:hypothetical protein
MIDLIVDTYGDPNGKELYIVTTIDEDDSEDTDADLWKANDELHLYILVKETYLGEEPDDPEDFSDAELALKFERDWGMTILYKKIANIT